MILFRVDGNKLIASGHVMRCLSFAIVFRSRGIDSAFVCADDAFMEKITKENFDCYVLNTNYRNMDAELPIFEDILKELNPEAVIVDSYFVTYHYLYTITEKCKTAYIDDLNAFDYPVNVVINYCVSAKRENYRSNKNKVYFLGPSYTPLRQQFLEAEKCQINPHIENVLITIGGSDSFGFCTGLFEYILNQQLSCDFTFSIVAGTFMAASELEKLRILSAQSKNIVLHHNVDNMSNLMLNCDVAVSAGGSTLYELCYCGVPTIVICTADNQKNNISGFVKQQAIVFAGEAGDSETYAAVCMLLGELKYQEKRKTLSKNAVGCVPVKVDNIFEFLSGLGIKW